MLNYEKVKINVRNQEEKYKEKYNSLYMCIKEQWLYKYHVKKRKHFLSNIDIKFHLNSHDIKLCLEKNENHDNSNNKVYSEKYVHLNILTNIMLNILAYELHNIYKIEKKLHSIFSLMNIKNSNINNKIHININKKLNRKQKIALFYYSSNVLIHIIEILSQYFKKNILYFSEKKNETIYEIYSFVIQKAKPEEKIIILKEGNVFKVYNPDNKIFKKDMNHLMETSKQIINIKI